MQRMQRPVLKSKKFTYGVLHIHITEQPGQGGAACDYGAFCSFGANIRVMVGGHHATNFITTYPFGRIHENVFGTETRTYVNRGDVLIGNDVWIGDNVTIMGGVTIGDGAVIGCNAVVTKDVEPYSIVAGNPGRFIRYRFSKEVIRQLLEIKWWDLPLNIIQEIVPYLMSPNIEENIPKIQEIVLQI